MRRILGLAAALCACLPVIASANCGPDSLGTSRTMRVDATGGTAYGTKQYASTLALGPREVVLTFDDGPHAGTTARVLDALERECVKATFFLIGRNAQSLPGLVQRTARAGHTIANHTMTHPWTIDRLSHAQGLAEIDDGAAAIRTSLGGSGTLAPFVRFPGFVSTPALMKVLASRNVAIFGTDLWASDWNPMSPERQLAQVMGRLRQTGRGIILFHDTQEQTAAMIPAFLRALKAGGYRVVHVTG